MLATTEDASYVYGKIVVRCFRLTVRIHPFFAIAINRFIAETNQMPKPFTWTANPDKIIAAVKRGHQVLDSVH